MPKPFKKTLTDKLPEWEDKFRAEGLQEADIQKILKGKNEKYVGKWGNTSKVGIIINSMDDGRQANEE